MFLFFTDENNPCLLGMLYSPSRNYKKWLYFYPHSIISPYDGYKVSEFNSISL